KRAGDDKAPKEERDVLFIERILKMLKPGGRAAIVLPQGKFNNSSLAFIREWILKKARLLAVVGLHPNTFKPHTGTKTSVLFVQKYTPEQLAQIAQVHDQVAGACPNYEADIKALLSAHEAAADVPDDSIPEAVADLIAESFSEPEADEAATGNGDEESAEGGEDGDEAATGADEDRAAVAEEKLDGLKTSLLKAKQKLIDLDSDAEALAQKQEQELEALKTHWTGDKGALRLQVQEVRQTYQVTVKKLKDARKDQQKALKAEIKSLEKQIPLAETALKLLSNRGKLELMLADVDLIGTLKERWIAAEVAKQLDYPIFMAVSQRGGKDNSGDYKHLLDEGGSLVEFPDGHPQEGQLVIDQDLVNYDLRAGDLAEAAKIPDDQLCVAEAFVRFAQAQKFGFWGHE
ncbi:MAG: N-6 DNA methylase, partial [Rhizobium sp.]|nr:N-6 DNA methylase [Rhizobium sp.]